MHSGLPVIIALVAFGLAVFTHLQPGWASRAFSALRIGWRAFLHGQPMRDIPHIASEQSDPQWEHTRIIEFRQRGLDSWDWDDTTLENIWRDETS